MAITSGPHQSPQSQSPILKYKTKNTFTWGAGGSTVTITDPYIVGGAFVLLNTTGTVPRNGVDWAITYTPTTTSTAPSTGVQTVTSGSFTITSSDSESSTLTVEYIII